MIKKLQKFCLKLSISNAAPAQVCCTISQIGLVVLSLLSIKLVWVVFFPMSLAVVFIFLHSIGGPTPEIS